MAERAETASYLRSANLSHGGPARDPARAPKRARTTATAVAANGRPQRQRKKTKFYDTPADADLEERGGSSSSDDSDFGGRNAMVHVVSKRRDKDSSHSRPKAIAARSTVASSAGGADGERNLRDRETPLELGSLKALLSSLDTPDSDVCSSTLATIRAHLPSDDVVDLLQLSPTELRQLLATCDLRPVSRTIVLSRISAAGPSARARDMLALAADQYGRQNRRKRKAP